MRITHLVSLAFTFLLLASCAPELPETNIVVNLANSGNDKLEVFNIGADIIEEITGELDTVSLAVQEEIILNLSQERSHSYIHIQPGSTVYVDTVSSKPTQFGVTATPSTENAYLLAFAETVSEQSKVFSMRKMAAFEQDSFLLQLNEKYAPLEDLVNEIAQDASVSDYFKSALTSRVSSLKGGDLLNYEGWHNYLNKTEPVLSDDFYAEIEAMDFTDPSLLLFNEGRSLGSSWATKDISYDDFSSDSDYFAATIEAAKESYPNSLLGAYCTYEMISNQINFGSGIDGSDEMVAAFRSSVSNNYLNAKMDQTLEPWMNLKAGLDAPDFVAFNTEGEEVKLSELKGKKVYIDVWATWCGPCVREIPALKELESELHEEDIVFLSVSIDAEKDKEKWLKFVEEKELKGLQLMAEGDWKSEVASSYNVKGIPRFMLIDPEGKILTANAPRPSDPSTKELLLN